MGDETSEGRKPYMGSVAAACQPVSKSGRERGMSTLLTNWYQYAEIKGFYIDHLCVCVRHHGSKLAEDGIVYGVGVWCLDSRPLQVLKLRLVQHNNHCVIHPRISQRRRVSTFAFP